ncbi:MAG: glycoside hydrolase family 99-like domain-containing protein [Paludibacteraceae bacterium]|nr:glycoside hydrolase family 99-like domain-containing protein [Paludibacteraceae bacterium]
MKVLLVHSGNAVAGLSNTYTFVHEQGEALRARGIEIDYYAVVGKGARGYLRNIRPLRKKIKDFQPDIVHAHYGLSGMLAVLSTRIPVVITCHNGETHTHRGSFFSSIALLCARHSIYVAQHIRDMLYFRPRNYTILPCGIDLENLAIVPKTKAQKEMNLPQDKINILFGGAFINERKNAPLARAAIKLIEESEEKRGVKGKKKEINLIEMRGYNRHQVAMLLCGCDMLLLPTKNEGSPQVVKEAMACNCPVVATDVADIAHLLHGVKNSYVTTFEPEDVADKIKRVIDSGERSDGLFRIQALRLSNPEVAETIHQIYCNILHIEMQTEQRRSEKDLQILAFYLPQYYPIPENNQWFGEGFTEWTNVGKAKPLFHHHYQPLVPADLGYYDLRLPQVRAKQAELAKEAGVAAFCYYHYWFGNGKQLLDMPLREVTRLGEPDFPFCICWANHTWYNKTWNSEKSVLDMVPIMPQTYPGEDDWDAHFYSLLDTFRDRRYYRINGKLVWVFYHVADIPNAEKMMQRWNELAQKEGLDGFYYMSYVDDVQDMNNPAHQLCKDVILSCKENITSVGRSTSTRKFARFIQAFFSQLLHIPLGVYRYSRVRKKLLDPRFADEDVVPVLYPNWDNTARRKMGAMVLHDATPEQFYLHCKEVFRFMRGKKNRVVFLKSWNEWGEGNYMEPCLRYGHGYIRALRRALDEENANNIRK